jgi:hypothetical protein
MWFKGINDLDSLRKKYKELLIKFHPDNNPERDTTSIMQEINKEYDECVKTLNGDTSSKTCGFDECDLKEVLQSVVAIIGADQNVQIEIIGRFIWLSGDTYKYKGDLKNLGFRFSGKKKMWYWGTLTSHCNKEYDMAYIRSKYGSVIFNTKQDTIGTKTLYAKGF